MDRTPTDKELKFAQVYTETHDAIKAYKAAYGEEKASKVKYLAAAARQKLNNPVVKSLIEEMQQGLRAQYVLLAPDALENIWDLANNASSEKVRLEANREILYGAGMKPPEEVKLSTVGVFGSASVEDIRQLIRRKIEGDGDNSTEEERKC